MVSLVRMPAMVCSETKGSVVCSAKRALVSAALSLTSR